MAALDLIVTHLNAPYGPRVRAEHVEAALRAGSLSAVADETPRAIVASLFLECSPALIARAAVELGVPLASVQALYWDTKAAGEVSSREWEREMEWVA